MKTSPSTTSTKPAIAFRRSMSSTVAIAADPAPSATNTTVKPIMNGMLATAIRLATPFSESRSASIDETAVR